MESGGAGGLGRNVKRAGRAATVLAAVAGAGLGSAPAGAASQPVAWGVTRSAPAGTLGELFGVAAASAADALAVGGYNPGKPPAAVLTNPYAEHWNGSGWAATQVPLGKAVAAQLNGVTEPAAADGWAVGTISSPSSFASQTLAYHWDGTAWTRSSTPNPAGPAQENGLNAVAARAASDVWAAGGDGPSTAAAESSLVLHWNGSAWRQVRVPNIGSLDAVTFAPGRIWIAGGDQVNQFNGAPWTTLPTAPGVTEITGLADTAAGLWAVGYMDVTCGEGICTRPWAALWNGTTWTEAPAGAGTGLFGVVAAGPEVLAASVNPVQVLRLTLTGATPQVTPQLEGLLNAITADHAGHLWAAGRTLGAHNQTVPAIINAPGIGQGGITVATGAAEANVTWAGPVTGAGGTGESGHFAVGGLPDGSYTITASLPGCHPGIATAQVTAGVATAVKARISCPP
jgi:hypothetical protein